MAHWVRRTAAAGVCLFLMLVVAVATGHRTAVELPKPSGRYPVGRVVRTVTFPPEDVATGGAPLQRVLWCWYPSMPNQPTPSADYLPPAWRAALAHHRGALLSTVANRDLARVLGHSVDASGVAPSPSPFPLVLLRAGLAALVADYTSLAEELASHGYVVVGLDVPERTAVVVLADTHVVTRSADADPERLSGTMRARAIDSLITAWTDDMTRLADGLAAPHKWLPELDGRIDATRISVVGHSLGGAVAAEFCRRDARCDLGVDLDGALGSAVVAEGLTRPFAFVLSDHGSATDAESRVIAANIQSVFERLPAGGRWRATIRGANHFSFSDQMLVRNPVPMGLLRGLGLVALAPRRGLQVSSEIVRRLLDSRRGGGDSAGPIDVRTDDLPEVTRH